MYVSRSRYEHILVRTGRTPSIFHLRIRRRQAVQYSHSVVLLTYLLTYSLTPWSRVLLEKVTGSHLAKIFPAKCGEYLSLSWPTSIQSMPPHPTSWRSFLILTSHLRLGLASGHFPSCFQTKTQYTSIPHTYYMPIPSTYVYTYVY